MAKQIVCYILGTVQQPALDPRPIEQGNQSIVGGHFIIIRKASKSKKIFFEQYGKNTAKSGAILAFIKSHSKIKIGKDIMFKFKYNNHTQYGDNDTYNQWIDNRNILIISNNKAFADIN